MKSDALLCTSCIASLYEMMDEWKAAGEPSKERFTWKPKPIDGILGASPLIWVSERCWQTGHGPHGPAHWEIYTLPMINVSTSADGRLIVAVRGTNAAPEWFTDTDFTPVKRTVGKVTAYIHDGFDYCFESCQAQVVRTVTDAAAAIPGGAKGVIVTGHSLGGAVATLLALAIEASPWFASSGLAVVQAYLFAAPKVGMKNFAKAFGALTDLEILNIQNANDIVPTLPPDLKLFPFEPVGKLLRFDRNYGNVAENHKLASYIDAVLNNLVPTGAISNEIQKGTTNMLMIKTAAPAKKAPAKKAPAKAAKPSAKKPAAKKVAAKKIAPKKAVAKAKTAKKPVKVAAKKKPAKK